MKAAPFEYHVPRDLPRALALMAELEDARALAGGQSLMPMLNFRVASPKHLVDLNRIPQLSKIEEGQNGVQFGAMARQRDIEFSALVAKKLPLFAEAVRSVGHRQTRNRGTLGGSLCHLDPSAELPTVCMAMDAVLKAESRQGGREIAMRDFPAGFMTPSLKPGEILTQITVAPWTGRCGTAFLEYARRHGDFAIVSVAVLVEVDSAGQVKRASITLGGVGEGPVRMPEAERALIGNRPDESAIAAAARVCGKFDAMSDAFIPGWYRQQVAQTLAERALKTAMKRVGT
jgi:carbon-monoxide dehydrogenase medium subunit